MDVILAEKPDQGRKLAGPFPHHRQKSHIEIKPCDQFPDGAIVTWAIGHLCELADPSEYKSEWEKWVLSDLPIIPDQFRHRVIKEKSHQFNQVKKHLRSADRIIIATDPAREGEYIARIILQMSGVHKKSIYRLWCSSLTKEAIAEAFQNLRPGKDTESLYHEALARSCSDWLIGINTSRLFTILFRQKGLRETFSTGRVQTPLLYMIRRREEEIENFKPEPYWELIGTFETENGTYKGKHENRFKQREEAEQWLQRIQGSGVVQDVRVEQKKTPPPKLHKLSTLQAKLNRKYKIPPNKVLEEVQSLYEKGLVSYPRTDSQYVTPAEAKTFSSILHELKKQYTFGDLQDIQDNKRYVNPEKVSDHYAILPTTQVPDLETLSDLGRKVYDEIARSLIAAHHSDHLYHQTTVITDVNGVPFKSTGRQVIEEGWKKVYREEKTDDKEQETQTLPTLMKEEPVQAAVELTEGITKPPKPYAEGQLITLMATAGKFVEDDELGEVIKGSGLGTEATRSSIIEQLKSREYIRVRKNVVEVTEKGKMLVEVVRDTILAKPDLTARWEQYLYSIGQGQKPAQPFIEKSKELAKKLVQEAIQSAPTWNVNQAIQEKEQKEIVGVCPRCGHGIKELKKFFGCSGYQEGCKFTLPKVFLGKKLSQTNIKKLLEGKKTNLIKGFKSKKGNLFDAYLYLGEQGLQMEFPTNKAPKKKERSS